MRKLIIGLLAVSLIWGVCASGVGAVQVGDPAPQFTAQSTRGQITLSELAGSNVVVAFYFAAFTPV